MAITFTIPIEMTVTKEMERGNGIDNAEDNGIHDMCSNMYGIGQAILYQRKMTGRQPKPCKMSLPSPVKGKN